MKVKDILNVLEEWAPKAYQESYDNSGLLVGNENIELFGVSVTLDVTEEVINEAIANGHNLIVAHHPLIFSGIKSLSGDHWVQRCIIKAIKHDLCIYAIHTNLDNALSGVNAKIADKIGLGNYQILNPKSSTLCKLVTFVPLKEVEKVANALYAAGAGAIGNYDQCSFQGQGTGTFRPNEQSNPTIGQANQLEKVDEIRLEVIFPAHKQSGIISNLKANHPYEEVAYYIQSLNNRHQEIGSGGLGILPSTIPIYDFLLSLKQRMNLKTLRHTHFEEGAQVDTVALCGGSGRFLLDHAKRAQAQVFITADFKYHDFFEADQDIVVVDIGHYESEVYTKELIRDYLTEKFANIAVHLSEVDTNPIKYL